MIKQLRSSDFIRSVATLVSGTIIAQALSYLLQPVITRLYTAEEMSYQSVFVRIVGFIAVIATIRLELAFTLPKRVEHAYSLFRVSVRSMVIVTIISCIAAIGLQWFPFNDEHMPVLLLLVPLGTIALSLSNLGTNWAIRLKDFRRISYARMAQSLGNSGLSVLLAPMGYLGVIAAYALSYLGASVLFLKNFRIARRQMKKFRMSGRDFAIAKAYSEFPRVNLPHALVDLAKELFIALYMIYTFDKSLLGYYDLSFRMLKMPIAVIGSSISQVFLKRAVDHYNNGQSVYPLFKRTIFILVALSIVPFTALMIYGQELFAFVFGPHWKEAGYYSQIMAPWLMVNFLISPVSMIPSILKKQRGFFWFGLLSAIMLVITLAIGSIVPGMHLTFVEVLWLVSASQFGLSLIVLGWLFRLAKKYGHSEAGHQ